MLSLFADQEREAKLDSLGDPLTVLTDLSGRYSDFSGKGSVEAVKVVGQRYSHQGQRARSLDTIALLQQRGVRMTVLTNSLAATDLPLVHGGYMAYRQRLLQAGVELHEMRAWPDRKSRWRHPWRGSVSLHSKALIFDRRTAFVGSFNMDPRSAFWNTEIGVLLESEALAGQLYTLADQAMEGDVSYRLKLDKGRLRWHFTGPSGPMVSRFEGSGPWRRLLAWFSARFAPSDWL